MRRAKFWRKYGAADYSSINISPQPRFKVGPKWVNTGWNFHYWFWANDHGHSSSDSLEIDLKHKGCSILLRWTRSCQDSSPDKRDLWRWYSKTAKHQSSYFILLQKQIERLFLNSVHYLHRLMWFICLQLYIFLVQRSVP